MSPPKSLVPANKDVTVQVGDFRPSNKKFIKSSYSFPEQKSGSLDTTALSHIEKYQNGHMTTLIRDRGLHVTPG